MIQLQSASEMVEKQAPSVWDYVSASRLNLWLRCPRAFRLRYVDGVRTPTTPSLFIGKAVHYGLQVYYRHRQLGIPIAAEEVVRQMLDWWDEAVADEPVPFQDGKTQAALCSKAEDLVRAYMNSVSKDEPQPLAVETSLQCPLVDPKNGEDLGVPLLGIVDLVLGTPPNAVIVDFKTAASSAAPVPVTHEIQLGCYAYLFRQVTGRSEAALEIRSLIKTKRPQIALHRYAARERSHFQRLFTVIRAYLDDLDRQRFLYRPTWGCTMCEFRENYCA